MPPPSPAAAHSYRVDIIHRAVNLDSAPDLHIGISLNNPKHRGAKLGALLEWAVARYARVQVNLHDTLQWHNIAFSTGCSEEVAKAIARGQGQAWIAENGDRLPAGGQVNLVLRDALLAIYRCEERISELRQLYDGDPLFRALVDADIVAVLERRHREASAWSESTLSRFQESSRAYILDELALMSVLNERERFVEVYPGSFLKLLHNPERLRVKDLPEGLRHYPMVEVDFVRQRGVVLQLHPRLSGGIGG